MNASAISSLKTFGSQADKPKQTVEEYAGTVVGQTFMGTLLKQLRESPFADGRFTGGKAGESYASMLDMHLSEVIGPHLAPRLSDAIARSIHKSKQKDGAGSTESSTSSQLKTYPTTQKATPHVTTDLRA